MLPSLASCLYLRLGRGVDSTGVTLPDRAVALPSAAMLAIDTTPLRRPRRAPAMLGIALVTSVAASAGMFIAARAVVDEVPRVEGVAAELSPADDTVDNYLLVGSDSRAAGDPNTGEGGGDIGNRSDTMMVLRYDKAAGTAALLSIPRDLYADVAGHRGRINGAYNDGPAELVRVIKLSLDIPIHHYVEIDFFGFKDLVDALGGVTVCFPYPARDFNTGLDVPYPGCWELNGTQGLAYARSRHYEQLKEDGQWHEDPTSDLGRSTRQRDFVNRCLQSALETIKADPFRAGDLARAMMSAIRIDTGLDPIDAAGSLRSAVDAGLGTYSLPVYNETIDGAAVLQLADGAAVVLAYFRGDGPPPAVAA